MEYLIGIDVGTQGTKGGLICPDGRVAASAFEESRLRYGSAGEVEQDPDEILQSVLNVLRALAGTPGVRPEEIRAIALDGQMAGIMGVDETMTPVTPYDSWLDTRCEPYIARMKQLAGETVIATTGCPVTYAHGPKILWWKHERPEVFAKIRKFVTLTCFLTCRLAGLGAQDAYIDYTQLHFSGFGDVARLEWNRELLEQFGVPEDKMPRITHPWERVGTLTPEMAAACGLCPGTVLAAGCGDQAATSLGAGIVEPGQAFDVAGTASVFSCCVDEYRPDLEEQTIIFARSVLPDLWIPLAYINGGGMCLKWFAEDALGAESGGYARLDARSAAVERGSGGALFLPHFSGRVCPNTPKMKGGWLGLSWNHDTGYLFRAVMESIGYEYALYLQRIRSLVPQAECGVITVVGGGARSAVFNRIKADILGVEYRTIEQSDSALIGCAVIAGYCTGLYTDLRQVSELIRTAKTFPRDDEACAEYAPFVERYRSALEMTAAFYRKNS